MKNALSEMETLLTENRAFVLQVFYLDRHYISRGDVTPDLLQQVYTHQLKRRLSASNKQVPQLVEAVRTTNLQPSIYIGNVRFGVLLFGNDSKLLFEYYATENGDAALIQNHPYRVSGGLQSWTKQVIRNCFNTRSY